MNIGILALRHWRAPAGCVLPAGAKKVGRYGALLPLFRLVGVRCIAAFMESAEPTASPRRSPETRSPMLLPVRLTRTRDGAQCRRPGRLPGRLPDAGALWGA